MKKDHDSKMGRGATSGEKGTSSGKEDRWEQQLAKGGDTLEGIMSTGIFFQGETVPIKGSGIFPAIFGTLLSINPMNLQGLHARGILRPGLSSFFPGHLYIDLFIAGATGLVRKLTI